MTRPDRIRRADTYAAMCFYGHLASDEHHTHGPSRRHYRLRQLVEGWKARWVATLEVSR